MSFRPVWISGSLLDTDCVSCGMCIGTCPTGAVSAKLPLAKPGPWATTPVPSICHYCGTGCQLNYDAYGDSLIKVSRREHNPVILGSHCKKGAFGIGYVQDHERLRKARIRPGRELQETTVEDAIAYAGMRLKELSRRHSPEEIAVFVSPRLTNEETYLAQKLARVALRTHNVASFSRLVNRQYDCPEIVSTATYGDLADAQAILVVNSNLDDEHFVVDLIAKRAIRKGGRLVYIGSRENRTSEPAEVFLRCTPGTETEVVLGILKAFSQRTGDHLAERPDLAKAIAGIKPKAFEKSTGVEWTAVEAAAGVLAASIAKVMVFNKDFRGPRVPGDERLFASAAEAFSCPFLALREKSNMQGFLDMGASPTWLPGYASIEDETAVDSLEKEWGVVLRDLKGHGANLAQALADKKIKVAVVIGEDPIGGDAIPEELKNGLLAADFLLVADVFLTATASAANVVLPLSALAETSGTITNQERRVQRARQAIPPRSGMETWQTLAALAARMGHRFKMKYANTDEIFEEIRRVVPIYRGVVVDDPGADGVWDPGLFPLVRPEPQWTTTAAPTQPIVTLALDCL